MASKILFIEDNRTKADEVSSFLLDNYGYDIVLKDSFRTGLQELMTVDYSLVLLDMSLPTWERNAVNLHDGYEKLGGYTIMKEMKRKGKLYPTILITMFHEFGVGKSFMNLQELDKLCRDEFSDFYMGAIFYSSKDNIWKEELKKLVNLIHANINNR